MAIMFFYDDDDDDDDNNYGYSKWIFFLKMKSNTYLQKSLVNIMDVYSSPGMIDLSVVEDDDCDEWWTNCAFIFIIIIIIIGMNDKIIIINDWLIAIFESNALNIFFFFGLLINWWWSIHCSKNYVSKNENYFVITVTQFTGTILSSISFIGKINVNGKKKKH